MVVYEIFGKKSVVYEIFGNKTMVFEIFAVIYIPVGSRGLRIHIRPTRSRGPHNPHFVESRVEPNTKTTITISIKSKSVAYYIELRLLPRGR